jgi:hypothetical protein
MQLRVVCCLRHATAECARVCVICPCNCKWWHPRLANCRAEQRRHPCCGCDVWQGRESLPLIIILRNRLKYALTRREVTMICQQKLVKVDGKTRTDQRFPAGFMGACTLLLWDTGLRRAPHRLAAAFAAVADIVSIEKSGDTFRLLYDTKGRFALTPVTAEEAKVRVGAVSAVVAVRACSRHASSQECRVLWWCSSSCAV